MSLLDWFNARLKRPRVFARVSLSNRGATPLRVIIEPWAEEFTLRAGGMWLVEVRARRYGWVEVASTPDTITIYTWDTADFRILSEEREISGWTGPPVPFSPHER